MKTAKSGSHLQSKTGNDPQCKFLTDFNVLSLKSQICTCKWSQMCVDRLAYPGIMTHKSYSLQLLHVRIILPHSVRVQQEQSFWSHLVKLSCAHKLQQKKKTLEEVLVGCFLLTALYLTISLLNLGKMMVQHAHAHTLKCRPELSTKTHTQITTHTQLLSPTWVHEN